jgi:hypothetical protein
VREAGLLSPGRLNDIAKAHNLTSPMSSQVVHLDGQNRGQSGQQPDPDRARRQVTGGHSRGGQGPLAAVNHRLASMAVILFLWALAIFARLIVLQVVQHEKYVEIARKQQEERLAIPAPRGSIFDRNGQPLAISVPVEFRVGESPADCRSADGVGGARSFLKLDQPATLPARCWRRRTHS